MYKCCLKNRRNIRCLQILLKTCDTLHTFINNLYTRQTQIENSINKLSQRTKENSHNLKFLSKTHDSLYIRIKNLQDECKKLNSLLSSDRENFREQIKNTNNSLSSQQVSLKSRTIWVGLILIAILSALFVSFYFVTKRLKQGNSSIDKVHKAQDALQTAYLKMQEEAVKLDHRMMELFERQMVSASITAMGTQIDHSLVLKVADEIVRIEMNLSRMDASIKGYKQLIKAVQRIKDNFNANGYEIVDMLGKPYVAGIKAAVTFIIDENLEHGQQIITKIIKPQINYQQQMIQAAQIEVSQPE